MKKACTVMRLLVLTSVLFWPLSLWAQNAESLYTSSINVKSQNQDELNQAMQKGLAQVLLRTSGVPSALKTPRIVNALDNPQAYVVGFRYNKLNDPNPENTDLYALNLAFDETAIKKLLNEAGLPIWGANRAPLMVWWVTKGEGEREIVNPDTAPQIVQALSQQAKSRGVPLTFPLLDIQDTETLQAEDIWSFFLDKAKLASQRYGHENILVGRTDFINGFGESRWVLLLGDEEIKGEITQGELSPMLAKAIDFAADNIATRYAVFNRGTSTTATRLIVSNITNLQGFAAIEQYFQRLDAVKQVTASTIKQDAVTFELILNTDLAQFEKIVHMDNKLAKESTNEATTSDTTLYYRWNE